MNLAFTWRKICLICKEINENIHVTVLYGIVTGGMAVRVALNTELGARSNVQRAA